MREIKFRAWYEQGKEMFEVDVLAINPVGWDSDGTGVSLAYQPHIKVMQYTGLKDRNGKEIYEGDVLKLSNFAETVISEVFFGESAFRTYGNMILTDMEKGANLEVIGNIYEHPELLRGDKQCHTT